MFKTILVKYFNINHNNLKLKYFTLNKLFLCYLSLKFLNIKINCKTVIYMSILKFVKKCDINLIYYNVISKYLGVQFYF